jgi:hypothetical protein
VARVSSFPAGSDSFGSANGDGEGAKGFDGLDARVAKGLGDAEDDAGRLLVVVVPEKTELNILECSDGWKGFGDCEGVEEGGCTAPPNLLPRPGDGGDSGRALSNREALD